MIIGKNKNSYKNVNFQAKSVIDKFDFVILL